jgi:hypothetical protein
VLLCLCFEASLESCIILWKLAVCGHLGFSEEILECIEVDVDFKAEVECYEFLKESSLLYKQTPVASFLVLGRAVTKGETFNMQNQCGQHELDRIHQVWTLT